MALKRKIFFYLISFLWLFLVIIDRSNIICRIIREEIFMRVAKRRGVAGAAAGAVGLVSIPIVLLMIGLFIILIFNIILVLVVGIPAATLVGLAGGGYYLLSDNNTEELNIDENFDMKVFGENILLSSFDDVKDTHKIQVVVTKDDVNNLLYQGLHSFNLEQLTQGYVSNDVLGKAYLVIDGNDYHFYVDVNAIIPQMNFSLIKTRVHITTSLYEKYSTNEFVFKIKDVGFGKIYGTKGLIKKGLMTFVKDEMINEFIAKIGLSLKYNQNNLSISYNKDDILKDLLKFTGTSEGSNMYIDVVKAMLKQDLINFDFSTNNLVEGYVNLEKLHSNEYTTNDEGSVNFTCEDVVTDCKNKMLQLIDEGKVSKETSQSDLTSIFQYLFLGYEGSSDAIKAVVDPIDLSSVGITDKTTYKGFDLACSDDLLLNRMSATVNAASLMHGGTDVCRLTEKDITEYVRGRSLVGYTTLLTRTDPQGNFKLNFVTIDNFYCNLYQDKYNGYQSTIDFVVRINLNGYSTSLAFSTIIPSDGLKENTITFKVKDIKYGQMGGEDLTNMFFEIMVGALDGGDISISANKENHTITFNFGEILNQAKQSVESEIHKIPGKESWSGDDVFTGSNIILEMFGEDKNDDGQFGISLRNPISI